MYLFFFFQSEYRLLTYSCTTNAFSAFLCRLLDPKLAVRSGSCVFIIWLMYFVLDRVPSIIPSLIKLSSSSLCLNVLLIVCYNLFLRISINVYLLSLRHIRLFFFQPNLFSEFSFITTSYISFFVLFIIHVSHPYNATL